MSRVLTLITGASGFVGASIALRFLRAGHPVRLALRNAEQTHAFKEGKFAEFQDKISFAFVSDITAPGSYDEAVRDVEIIVHPASPATSVSTRTVSRDNGIDRRRCGPKKNSNPLHSLLRTIAKTCWTQLFSERQAFCARRKSRPRYSASFSLRQSPLITTRLNLRQLAPSFTMAIGILPLSVPCDVAPRIFCLVMD